MARVGIDVGGTKCLAVGLGDDDTVVAVARTSTPAGPMLVDALVGLTTSVAAEVGDPVASVGVGLPGLVDRDGVLRYAPNLVGVDRLAVAAPLSAALGVEVRADNDATCATWGESRCGAAQGVEEALMITIGTGIGGGIVSGGRLVRGRHGFAGELGHMVVVAGGVACPCGRRGCWERYASGSGLGRLAGEAAHSGRLGSVLDETGLRADQVRGEHVTAAARRGDAGAVAVVEEFARWLAVGLASLVLAFDPEVVVVGGGISADLDLVLGPATDALGAELPGAAQRGVPDLRPAVLGERAGAIGAALLEVG